LSRKKGGWGEKKKKLQRQHWGEDCKGDGIRFSAGFAKREKAGEENRGSLTKGGKYNK